MLSVQRDIMSEECRDREGAVCKDRRALVLPPCGVNRQQCPVFRLADFWRDKFSLVYYWFSSHNYT